MRWIPLAFILLVVPAGAPAQEAPAADGAVVYRTSCAHCHDGKMSRMPTLEEIREKTAVSVYMAQTGGMMTTAAAHLSGAERIAVAEYLTGDSMGGFTSVKAMIPKSAYCGPGGKPLAQTLGGPGWNGFSDNLANTRYRSAAEAGFGAQDLPKLKLRWAFGVPAADMMSTQPALVGDRLYFGTPSGLVLSLDAATGCIRWVAETHSGVRTAITVAQRPDGGHDAYFGDLSGHVHALDAEDGSERWKVRLDEHEATRITGAPVYWDGRLYVPVSSLEELTGSNPAYECCTFRGAIAALDASTGATLWKTRTIAEAPSKRAKNSIGTQRWGPSGAAIWSAPTLDPAHNVVYVTTGDSYSNPAAPESDAVMALAMDTGKVKWIRQTTRGDAWVLACTEDAEEDRINCPVDAGPDVDYGSSAILVVRPSGKRLLLAGQKSGVMHALDADTGEIRWKRQISQGGVLGGIEWGFSADDEAVYIAISDAWEEDPGVAGGFAALRIADGSVVWERAAHQGTCPEDREGCQTGQLGAVTGIPGAVFSGSLDGHLRAYATDDGRVLWDFDTVREFETVNGVPGRGGALNGPGPSVAGGWLYAVSGYGILDYMPGNVLLAFSVEK